jgi:hypothetical protein
MSQPAPVDTRFSEENNELKCKLMDHDEGQSEHE